MTDTPEERLTVIEMLEAALQLSATIPCECDRSEHDICSGSCLGQRVWYQIYRARKSLRAEMEEHQRLTGESVSSAILKAKAQRYYREKDIFGNQGTVMAVPLSDALEAVAELERENAELRELNIEHARVANGYCGEMIKAREQVADLTRKL